MSKNITYSQPVADLIKKRYSCRSFDGCGLGPEALAGFEKLPAGLELPLKTAPLRDD